MAVMQAASHYSLRRDDAAQDTSQLLRNGTRLALHIEGVLLEAQWQLADGRALLLLTDDSPYDEMLHIYLLDAQGQQVLDALEAGSPGGLGGAGVLSIQRHGDTWLELAFFKGCAGFRVEVAAQPQLRLFAPPGWRYKKLLSTHCLTVTELQTQAGGT